MRLAETDMKVDAIKSHRSHSSAKSSAVFVIAEAGVNHNGRLDWAIKLVDAAAAAGADAIKFQTFKAEQVVTGRGLMAAYQKKNTGKSISQRAMLRSLELSESFYRPIIARCKKRHLRFLSTPHGGRESVDFLESLRMPMYKIGSGDLTNYLLLARVAKTKKSVILSTGMATMREIGEALRFLKKEKSGPVSVLHCTTNYPCPTEEVNLRAMVSMMKHLHVPVGYSDHTVGIQTAIMAATLGAAIYECHFTLDKTLPGPDHRASADPGELKARVAAIRNVETILGNATKKPTRSETTSMVRTVRRSIVAAHDLPKGHRLKESDLEAKRPGDGLSPVYYRKLIGKRLNVALKKDDQLFLKFVRKG